MVARVLGNQIAGPNFVGGQQEFTPVDHIPRCLCSGGGGGAVAVWNHTRRIRLTFPDARAQYALKKRLVFGQEGMSGLNDPP